MLGLGGVDRGGGFVRLEFCSTFVRTPFEHRMSNIIIIVHSSYMEAVAIYSDKCIKNGGKFRPKGV